MKTFKDSKKGCGETIKILKNVFETCQKENLKGSWFKL